MTIPHEKKKNAFYLGGGGKFERLVFILLFITVI